jgi:hypothetical protein
MDADSGPVARDSKRALLLENLDELEAMLSGAAAAPLDLQATDDDEVELLEQLLLDIKEELRALDEEEAAEDALRDPAKELLAIAAAARSVLDLSARGPESRAAIRALGGLEPVLQLLESDSWDVAKVGAIALGNLCCDEPANRELLVAQGAVAALLSRGLQSFETALQDAAAFALGNLVADCQVRISDCVQSNLHTNLESGPLTARRRGRSCARAVGLTRWLYCSPAHRVPCASRCTFFQTDGILLALILTV